MKLEIDPRLPGNWQSRVEERVMLELSSSAATLEDLTIELLADFGAGEPPVYVCRVSAWDKRSSAEPYCIEMRNRSPDVSLSDALARLRRQLHRNSRLRTSGPMRTSAALQTR